MKKLQAIKADPTRLWTNFAQVYGGRVTVVHPHMIVSLPVEEVLGQDDATIGSEVLYLDRNLWGLLKFPSATLTAWDAETRTLKNIKHGTEIKLLTQAEYDAKSDKYPDWPMFVHAPDKELSPVTWIGFNANYLKAIVDTWGIDSYDLRYNFYGNDRAILIDTQKTVSGGWALLFPVKHQWGLEESSFYLPVAKQEEPEPTVEDFGSVVDMEAEPEPVETQPTARFVWNDSGVCLNPDEVRLKLKKGFCELHAAESEMGYHSGYRFEYGTTGSSAPVMRTAEAYQTAEDATAVAANRAAKFFNALISDKKDREALDAFLAPWLSVEKPLHTIPEPETDDISELL